MLYYCIDLDDSNPEVMEYPPEIYEVDLKEHNLTNPLDYSKVEPNRRVFRNESDADEFLAIYRAYLSTLSMKVDSKETRDSSLPCMLYKRRYIVLALLGLKKFTMRDYRKEWKPGQCFYFHDQVNFLKVKLEKISEEDGGYRYDYTLA